MISRIIRFPVVSFHSNPGSYISKVKLKDIAHKFDAWSSASLPDPDMTSLAVRTIKQFLTNKPEKFHIHSFGIILHVHHVFYDKATRIVSIELSDPDRHGFIEGEPMYRIICNYLDELDEITKNHHLATIELILQEEPTERDLCKS